MDFFLLHLIRYMYIWNVKLKKFFSILSTLRIFNFYMILNTLAPAEPPMISR